MKKICKCEVINKALEKTFVKFQDAVTLAKMVQHLRRERNILYCVLVFYIAADLLSIFLCR
jgi:hypothetical protein